MGHRGDAIVQFDWTIGEVMKTLKDLNIDENTIIILTSDSGPVVDDGYDDEAVARLGSHKPSGPLRGNKYSSFEDVEKTFSKSFSRPVKRSYNYDLEVYQSDEVKTFHELIKLISSKDGFNEYSYEYYNNVFEELNKKGYIKIFNVKIQPLLFQLTIR
jgi:arylsulfatase A-like enzyme